jgi:hypothetical protein
MKIVKIILFTLFIIQSIDAQVIYEVKFIKDTVYVKNYQLRVGDFFYSNDSTFSFKNKEGLLLVCLPECKKRKFFSAENVNKTQSKSLDEFEGLLKLGSRNNNYSGLDIFTEVLKYKKIGIIDTLKIPLKGSDLKIDKTNILYVSFKHKGKEINQILKSKNDFVIISREIFKLNNRIEIVPDELPISIYHYNATNKKNGLITSLFHPVFIDSKKLEKNMKYISSFNILNELEKQNYIKEYLKIEYPNLFFNLN